ncbi:MAG: glycosyltransferase [Muribaculum sp.]|nr:glycosyltransferase [Muribaculum sp.]
MRILFLIRWFPQYGGVERISALLANELARRGWQPYIYAAKGNANADTFVLDERVTVKIEGDRLDPEAAAAYVAAQKIDVVVNQVPYITEIPVIDAVKSRTGVPVVSVIHMDPRNHYEMGRPMRENSTPFSYVLKKIGWPLYKIWSLRRVKRMNLHYISVSDVMMMLSPAYVPAYGTLHGMTADQIQKKIKSIPNFLPDESYVEETKREELLSGKRKEIIFVGRVTEHQKRISRLLRIWEKFAPYHPEWNLTLVGDGNSMEKSRRYVSGHGIERISFEGFRDDVRGYYRRASVFVLVSDSEGFPMSQIEAMREGCVSVCYDSYLALEDIVSDGVEGFNIPFEDEERFLAALHQLANDEEMLRRMQKSAMEKAAKYCASAVVPMWEEVLKNLAQKKD